MTDTENEAPSHGNSNSGSGHQHVSQPHITVSLGGGGVKAIIGALIGVAIILLLTVPVAKGADDKATSAGDNEKRFEERVDARAATMAVDAQMTHLWMQRAIIACEAHGVKMPELPNK